MKRAISKKDVDVKSKKRKVVYPLKSILEIDYVILNQCKVLKPKNDFLHFTLSGVKFDCTNISVRGKLVAVLPKDIIFIRYCSENSLICLTLTEQCYNSLFPLTMNGFGPENSVWFCIRIADLDEYLDTFKRLCQLYSHIFPIEPMTAAVYRTFLKHMSPTINGFVSDWDKAIVVTLVNEGTERRTEDNEKHKLCYNPGNVDNVEVINEDLLCLRRNKCLNDNIINFYLIYIYHEILSDEQRQRSYFFNVFFNTKLIGSPEQQLTDTESTRHARVAKWTKKVDIFTKDFLIIPVIEDTHWFLVIVCFPWMAGLVDYCQLYDNIKNTQSNIPENKSEFATVTRQQRLTALKQQTGTNPMPCILIFDSVIFNKTRLAKVKIIREYLKSEWDSKRAANDGPLIFDKTTCRGYGPKVPQQSNSFDCGIYLLHYVESFFKDPFVDFGVDFFSKNLISWFDKAGVQDKRRQIQEIITNKLSVSKGAGGD